MNQAFIFFKWGSLLWRPRKGEKWHAPPRVFIDDEDYGPAEDWGGWSLSTENHNSRKLELKSLHNHAPPACPGRADQSGLKQLKFSLGRFLDLKEISNEIADPSWGRVASLRRWEIYPEELVSDFNSYFISRDCTVCMILQRLTISSQRSDEGPSSFEFQNRHLRHRTSAHTSRES